MFKVTIEFSDEKIAHLLDAINVERAIRTNGNAGKGRDELTLANLDDMSFTDDIKKGIVEYITEMGHVNADEIIDDLICDDDDLDLFEGVYESDLDGLQFEADDEATIDYYRIPR